MLNLTIFACYISPNSGIKRFKKYLHNLGQEIRVRRRECIVVGDFNSKSRSWGSKEDDPRGAYLIRWAAPLSLAIANRGDVPTFVRGGVESHLNLTLTSLSTYTKITDWRVPKATTAGSTGNWKVDA